MLQYTKLERLAKYKYSSPKNDVHLFALPNFSHPLLRLYCIKLECLSLTISHLQPSLTFVGKAGVNLVGAPYVTAH